MKLLSMAYSLHGYIAQKIEKYQVCTSFSAHKKPVKRTVKEQGRSQDFSVGTHSFPSHLFTPPPPQKKKIKVIFDSRVFYFKSRAQES